MNACAMSMNSRRTFGFHPRNNIGPKFSKPLQAVVRIF
jgi:hypothetical protein